ncbi:P-loop containing nucleoside triphosphate hydrolase protein [Jaminaea rosea]|uniref:P-loop containing nucleoside triphosphate hydrolase protein n=1 Tax=Jaminaea rosea TaxID=1569628 RepID=A0A316UVZ5_9BASI|nr:P-loop containing nucleoside triphosphate hydrolase protein [Jaminaea rosea]PWN28491.1 P-loop containing nucleoside triphosphate hydrolase protein [Jaminaea rosea]
MSSMPDFTDKAAASLNAAIQLAKDHAHPQVQPAHLALALLTDDAAASSKRPGTPSTSASPTDSLFRSVLTKAGVDVNKFEQSLRAALRKTPQQNPPPDDVSLSGAAAKILRSAESHKSQQHDSFVAQDHLLLALLDDSTIETQLKSAGLANKQLLKTAISSSRGARRIDTRNAEQGFDALNKYCVDLTALATEGKIDPVIGRDETLRRVVRVLSRRTKNNVALIGEPGVGKTAVVEALAQRIVDNDVPPSLTGRLLSLDMGSLMAGAKFKGEFEERVKSVLEEIEKAQETTPVILFIDEMHLIMAGREGGSMDAGNLVKPALARGKLRCIGATTLNEYRTSIEKDSALERRFQTVIVQEPTVEQTVSILRGIKDKYQHHHGVRITDPALVSAARLAKRHLTARKLPDAAIDLVDEACADTRVTRETVPAHIDDMQRRKIELEVAVHALEREAKKDAASKESLDAARKDLASLEENLQPALAEWEAKRAKGDELANAKRRLDELRSKAEAAERRRDVATAADLKYGAIPDLENRIVALEAEEKARAEKEDNAEGTVGPEQIATIVARWTGIPLTKLQEGEKEKLLRLEKLLSREVVGQPEAVKAVADSIRLSRSGLADPNRPVSFLFAGPSGTGKTLTAKSLAKLLFDDETAMVRIDASEYSEKHAVARLLGAPPGYVGYEQGGTLSEAVRRKPFSVILVDELEKAAREFVQLWLQILDDGRATDGQGRTVSFKDTLIVFTSNLGAQFVNDDASETLTPNTINLVQGALAAHLPPEFRNRLSATVVFQKLTRANIQSIVDQRVREITARLRANGRRIAIELSAEARTYLGERGYDPSMGARPLQRVITNEVLSPLSILLLRGGVRDGETARIGYDAASKRIVVAPNHELEAIGEDAMDTDDMEDDQIDEEPLD